MPAIDLCDAHGKKCFRYDPDNPRDNRTAVTRKVYFPGVVYDGT